MSKKTVPFEITEKDIESVIRYLKITDPDNANREWAITILQQLQAKFHSMAHKDMQGLKKIYEELKKKKKTIN